MCGGTFYLVIFMTLTCSALLSSLPHVCLNKDTDFMTVCSVSLVRGGSEV